MIERITQIILLPENEPIFSEQAFIIQIDDDAGGEYVTVKCYDDQCAQGEIRIDPSEWAHVKAAVDRMMKEVKCPE